MTASVVHRREALATGTVLHTWSPPSPPHRLVLLQHGFAEHAERYVTEHGPLLPALLDRGCEVWAVDLPGHGRSPGRRGVTDTEQAVREHLGVRRRLSARGLPTTLFGHSYGGLVTAASVARDAQGASRVVLTAPVVLGPTAWPLRAAARVLAAVAPGAHVPGRAAVMAHDVAVAERAAADPMLYRGTTTFRVGATALDVAHRMWRQLGGWRTPATVFHGTRDTATSHARSVAFVAAVGRPDVVLRSVPDGYHELLHDVPGDRSVLGEVVDAITGGRGHG